MVPDADPDLAVRLGRAALTTVVAVVGIAVVTALTRGAVDWTLVSVGAVFGVVGGAAGALAGYRRRDD